ncbi:hypothetical protein [Methanosarcina siciliae]|uniref:hypothetical protein n=1 Tax=Methanosarcina siciliae TaxID=38027 RepID=UPI00064F7054|nr:hypothetical protein [Methanosarcina siciliae]
MDIDEYHAAWRRFCRPSVYEKVQCTQDEECVMSSFVNTAEEECVMSSFVNTAEEECVMSSFVDTDDYTHPITAFVLNASDEQLEAFSYLDQWMQQYGIRFCNSDSCECEHTEVFHGALRFASQRLGTD